MPPLPVPPASADAVEHADWLELLAFSADDRNSSHSDLTRAIHRGATTEVLNQDETAPAENDQGDEQSQLVADAAWSEVERRSSVCGARYPFAVGENHIACNADAETKAYTYLLLLTQYGNSVRPTGLFGERIFEEAAVVAAQSYLTSTTMTAKAFHFGHPRPTGTGFRTALVRLLAEMGDGQINHDAALLSDQNDSHLDVVAWLPFGDSAPSQLIAFGQCATGSNWRTKTTELSPKSFQRKWFLQHFHVDPIQMFFVPHSIKKDLWPSVSADAGIIFERCRLTNLLVDVPAQLGQRWAEWTAAALTKLREA